MTKIICVILIVAFAMLFCGCGRDTGENYTTSGRFVIVSGSDQNAPYFETVIKDRETGVLYLVIYGLYRLGITPILNADGSPMTLDGVN